MGQGFILLRRQRAVLSESDAGNDSVETASGFVIQNRHTSYSIWCRCMGTLLPRDLWFVQWYRTRNSVKDRDPVCTTWMNGIAQHQSQANELNQVVQNKFIPTSLVLLMGMKARSLEVFLQYSVFHLCFVH